MITNDKVVADIKEVNSILNDYITMIYDLKNNWKGKSYDNVVLKAEGFRGPNLNKIGNMLRYLSNAASRYNDSYLKCKSSYDLAKKNYDSTDDGNADKAVYKGQMDSYSSKMAEDAKYIKAQLADVKNVKVDDVSSIKY